jgi:hypothetical protein
VTNTGRIGHAGAWARERRDEAIAELERSLDLPDREARDRRNRAEAASRLARLREASSAASRNLESNEARP